MVCLIIGKLDAEGTSGSSASGEHNSQAGCVYSAWASEREWREEPGITAPEAGGHPVPGAVENARGKAHKPEIFWTTCYLILDGERINLFHKLHGYS